MSGNHITGDRKQVDDWQQSTYEVAKKIGDLMSGTGYLLAKNCSVVLVEGDFRYDTVPRIKQVDDTIELTCNIEAFDEWLNIMAEAPQMDEENTRKLYLGVGVAQAELTLVSNPSVLSSKEFKGMQKKAIGSRALKLINMLESREGLQQYARQFEEEHELWGLENMVADELKPEQILRINQIRYGLAVSIFSMSLEAETELAITDSFVNQLKSDVEKREESYYEFLGSIAGNDFDEVSKKQEKIRAFSFPELLFAGTMPMNIFEVIE